MHKYLLLQVREATYCFVRAVLAMAALFAVTFLLLFLVYKSNEPERESIVQIGVVSLDGNSNIIELLTSMVGEVSDLEKICSFTYMDEANAKDGLSSGKVDMVIEVPYDFYSKAVTMQDTQVEVYVGNNLSTSKKKILAIAESIQQMMITTEGSIYAMYDGMDKYTFPVTRGEMETKLFLDVINGFLDRDSNFEIKGVSAYGQYDYVQYMFVTIVIFVIASCSVTYFNLYSKGDMQLESILGTNYISRVFISVIKICSVAIPIGIVLCVMTFLIDIFDINLWDSQFIIGIRTYGAIWLFSISIGVFVHFIVSICVDKGNMRTIYWLVLLILIASSGCLVPVVYLPAWIRGISSYLPAGQWQGVLLAGFWSNIRKHLVRKYIMQILITDVFLGAVATGIYSWRLRKHD